jgi:hypothetical protein
MHRNAGRRPLSSAQAYVREVRARGVSGRRRVSLPPCRRRRLGLIRCCQPARPVSSIHAQAKLSVDLEETARAQPACARARAVGRLTDVSYGPSTYTYTPNGELATRTTGGADDDVHVRRARQPALGGAPAYRPVDVAWMRPASGRVQAGWRSEWRGRAVLGDRHEQVRGLAQPGEGRRRAGEQWVQLREPERELRRQRRLVF